MKKHYSKPEIEIERYQLSASIADNCHHAVNIGPGYDGVDPCDSFKDAFEGFAFIPGLGIQSVEGGTPFYDNNGTAGCDCYYYAGGGLYFSS